MSDINLSYTTATEQPDKSSAKDPGRPIARDNHFVPQALLKRWCDDGQTLYAYSLLVPDARVPEWDRKPIKSLAMRTDFYTVNQKGSDSDEIERWFAREFEQPGIEASQRLIDGMRVGADDWHAIVRLYALQEVRTPQSFIEAMALFDQYIPQAINDILQDVGPEMAQAIKAGKQIELERDWGREFGAGVQVELSQMEDGATLSAKVAIGRAFWLRMMRTVLEGRPVERLLRHKWRILTPANGLWWPVSDHPTLRLGYRSNGDHSFSAGWGRRKADLLMPLSPRHLLHAEVGWGRRGVFPLDEPTTRELRSLIVARAHRQVFAGQTADWVSRQRPRRVDKERFELERQQWQRWHAEQSNIESRTNS